MKFFRHYNSRKSLKRHVEVLEREIYVLQEEIADLKLTPSITPKSMHPTGIYIEKEGLYVVMEREGEKNEKHSNQPKRKVSSNT